MARTMYMSADTWMKEGMVKFGVVLPQYDVGFEDTLTWALECERLGFDSLWLEDHFWPWTMNPYKSSLECWTTLAAIAAKTRTIKIGSLCTCASYRQPSLLAKMVANIDVISNGRVILGIGAGWYEEEYKAYGITFPSPAERVRRLEESIKIVMLMWTQDSPSFKGRYYSIDRASCNPKPAQKPRPQIWIGGGGEKLMLPLVARIADGWNWGVISPVEFARKRSLLDELCRRFGRDPSSITKSIETFILMARDARELEEKLKVVDRSGAKALWKLYIDTSVTGTPSSCIQGLSEYVNAGVEYFTIVFPDAPKADGLRLFGKEVLPSLKG